VARVGSFTAVHPHVPLQVRRVRELHRTLGARERPVVVVHAHVLLQVRVLRELALTHVARHRRAVGRVGVQMTLQRCRADESHAADRAAVGSFAGMRADVPLEARRLRELLVAEDAVVRSVSAVHTHVLLQRAVLGELLAADVADERPVVRVTSQVPLHSRQSHKRSTTVVTGVLLLTCDDSG